MFFALSSAVYVLCDVISSECLLNALSEYAESFHSSAFNGYIITCNFTGILLITELDHSEGTT